MRAGFKASTASITAPSRPVSPEQVLQALEHEVLQLRGEALGGQQAGLEAGGGGVDQLRQPERQRRLDQDAQHAERGAAQRERVLVAGDADAEEADQGVELVGQRHRGGNVARGQRVAGKARLVVGLDGVSHHLPFTVGKRVVAAHDALQLGELAHHVGDEVGLGQARGALVAERRRAAARRSRRPAPPGARRARAGCRACCDRPPAPAAAGGPRASASCPARRRSARPTGAGAPRGRCRR